MGDHNLTLDKVISGKTDPIKLGFTITSIGSKDEPDYDNYLYSIQLPGMSKPEWTENLELKTQNKTFTGEVVWKLKYPIEGTKVDPEDEDEEREIKTYTFPDVVLKTFEDESAEPMAKATITYPFEAVVATANWKD